MTDFYCMACSKWHPIAEQVKRGNYSYCVKCNDESKAPRESTRKYAKNLSKTSQDYIAKRYGSI